MTIQKTKKERTKVTTQNQATKLIMRAHYVGKVAGASKEIKLKELNKILQHAYYQGIVEGIEL